MNAHDYWSEGRVVDLSALFEEENDMHRADFKERLVTKTCRLVMVFKL